VTTDLMGLHEFWALSEADKAIWTLRLELAGFDLNEVREFEYEGERVTRALCYVLTANGKKKVVANTAVTEWRDAR
jgi:hypothetical protein